MIFLDKKKDLFFLSNLLPGYLWFSTLSQTMERESSSTSLWQKWRVGGGWRNPTTNSGMQNGSSVEIHARCIHVFLHFWHQFECSVGDYRQKFLHRSSRGSLLRVRCWLGNGWQVKVFFGRKNIALQQGVEITWPASCSSLLYFFFFNLIFSNFPFTCGKSVLRMPCWLGTSFFLEDGYLPMQTSILPSALMWHRR